MRINRKDIETGNIPVVTSVLGNTKINQDNILASWKDHYLSEYSNSSYLGQIIPILTGGMPHLVKSEMAYLNDFFDDVSYETDVKCFYKSYSFPKNAKEDDPMVEFPETQVGVIGDSILYLASRVEYKCYLEIGCALGFEHSDLWVKVLNLMYRYRYTRPKPRKGQIYMMVMDDGELSAETFDLLMPSIELSLHYDEAIDDFEELILEKLNDYYGKGIVLLHGKPGTGKTTYLRRLIHLIEKDVIFVPNELVPMIGSSSFMKFAKEHTHSVLILEDAESVLRSREQAQNHVISNLLNLSDGLMSDFLNIQLICTFNTDLVKIDEAFLRPGRLIGAFEFKELSAENVRIIAESEGIQLKEIKPMTVAELYNYIPREFIGTNPTRNKVGFK